MSCELQAKNVFNRTRALIKTRDAFQGADLICRLTKPIDYPNRCKRRHKLQMNAAVLENEMFQAFMDYNRCLTKRRG